VEFGCVLVSLKVRVCDSSPSKSPRVSLAIDERLTGQTAPETVSTFELCTQSVEDSVPTQRVIVRGIEAPTAALSSGSLLGERAGMR
jgi:hypothetical protein